MQIYAYSFNNDLDAIQIRTHVVVVAVVHQARPHRERASNAVAASRSKIAPPHVAVRACGVCIQQLAQLARRAQHAHAFCSMRDDERINNDCSARSARSCIDELPGWFEIVCGLAAAARQAAQSCSRAAAPFESQLSESFCQLLSPLRASRCTRASHRHAFN